MTLTCDTAPVTDDDPKFTRLREIVAEVAEAARRLSDLEAARNAEIVRLVGPSPESGQRGRGQVSSVADVAGLSRQQVNVILDRAEGAAGRPRRPKHWT